MHLSPRKTAVLTTLLLLLFLALPYWLGYTFVARGHVFTGTLMNPEDSQTYFAKMLQGYDGRWLYSIPFTAEEHDPAFVGVFYMWLGQLARLPGLSIVTVWHGARVVAQLILSLTCYWFISRFLNDNSERLAAFLLSLFGSGLGWLLFLVGQPYWLNALPVDFKQPGAHLFFTALTFPHITLATALIMVSVWALWQLGKRPSWSLALRAGIVHLLLGIAYPFLIYLVALIALLLFAAKTWQSRRISWQMGFQYALSFLIPAPMYLYFASVLFTNDVFAAWDAQAGTPSAPWPHYLLAFGPMLLLAGLFGWRRPRQQADHLPLWAWPLAVSLLLYAPLGPQRRFVQGVHVPLAMLATLGFIRVILPWLSRTDPWQRLVQHPRYSAAGLSRLLLTGFLLVMSFSNLYLIASVSVSAIIQQPDPLFRPSDEIDASGWLREDTSGEGLLIGDMQTGNYVAAHAGNRVVLGHWAETLDYAQKAADVARFYDAGTSEAWRIDLIEQQGITHVWHGPREAALGSFDPETAAYLHPVFRNNTITIYAVRSP